MPATLKVSSRKTREPRKNPQKTSPPQSNIPGSPKPSFIKKLVDFFATFIFRFSRFGRDLSGIILLAIALIGIAAFFGITDGSWVSPVIQWLRMLLGWGNILLFAGIAIVGFFALRRSTADKIALPLGRVISLEISAFALLVLFSIASGGDVTNAQAGLDYGGLVGWGLSELLLILVGPTVRIILAIACLIIFAAVGIGVPKIIENWMDDTISEHSLRPVVQQLVDTGKDGPEAGAQNLKEEPEKPEKPQAIKLSSPYPSPKKAIKEKPLKQASIPVIFERDSQLPPLELLTADQNIRPDEQRIKDTGELLERSLADFGIPASVTGYRVGPTVTQYAVEPGFIEKTGVDGNVQRQKIRVSQISALARDLALALSAERLRIEAPVPGRSYVGIEVPNPQSTIVRLRSILESSEFTRINSPLAIALGRDVSGQPVVADLARMPHLLIAGTTGSGKSVCIAALTTCLIMNNMPENLRLIMIDPKMVELVRFNGVPHLLGKVETDIERILAVLKWTMAEMDQRYKLLEQARARDLDGYNRKMEKRKLPTVPKIVLLIDELADLMMSAPDQTEHSLVRLAQMARAVGIHLVVATQRPSTDVVTGLIKANFPARISFTVASSIDSRVILDTNGAETLLGRGDMLFLHPESGSPIRSQGVLITDLELEQIINYWRSKIPPDTKASAPWEELMKENGDGSDNLIQQAMNVVKGEHRASASLLQRRLRIGYPRAARLIDELEELGIVGPSQGGGKEREVLVDDESDGTKEQSDVNESLQDG